MFKKLFLVLTLVLIMGIGSSVYAFEEGETCTLLEGAKVIQVMPDRTLIGIIVPEEIVIMIGKELPQNVKDIIQEQLSGGMDWSTAHLGMVEVDLETGPVPIMLVVKEIDVIDCN